MRGMHERGGAGEAAGHPVQERRAPLCGCQRSARVRAGGGCSRNCARAGARRPLAPRAEQSAERDSCAFANTRRCESGVQHGTHQAGGWRRSSWRWARRSRSPQRRPRRPPRAWRGTRSAAPWHAGSWQLTIRCAEMRFLGAFFILRTSTRTACTCVNVNTIGATTGACVLKNNWKEATPAHGTSKFSSYHSVRTPTADGTVMC
jgi:hypothetical protein